MRLNTDGERLTLVDIDNVVSDQMRSDKLSKLVARGPKSNLPLDDVRSIDFLQAKTVKGWRVE